MGVDSQTICFMTRKKVCIVSLIGLVLGIAIDPYIIGLCATDKSLCIFDSLAHILGKPLVIIFLPLFLVSVAMFRFKKQIFDTWVRFVYFWLPITALFVILAPEYDSSLLNIQKDSVSLFMSGLFMIVSFFLVVYISIKGGKPNEKSYPQV